jgi:hypothetical protein
VKTEKSFMIAFAFLLSNRQIQGRDRPVMTSLSDLAIPACINRENTDTQRVSAEVFLGRLISEITPLTNQSSDPDRLIIVDRHFCRIYS